MKDIIFVLMNLISSYDDNYTKHTPSSDSVLEFCKCGGK